MSTRNPTHGTKVKDSDAPNIEENAGAIASDSLAAESTRAGGEFSKNRGGEPLGVAGANSTFANTDTSGAETLEPAPNSESRKAATENPDESYSPAPGGQQALKSGSGKTATKDSEWSNVSATKGQSKSTTTNDTTDPVETDDATSHAGVAPTYVNSQYVDTHGPKGKNLKEGGFDEGDDKNTSFTSDIGDRNDPGRLAEGEFAKENAEMDEDAVPKKGGSGEGLYDTLDDTSA